MFVGGSWIYGSSGTLPTHQAGDLLLVLAVKWSSSSPTPTVPSGWTSLASSTNTYRRVIAYRVASSAGTASGTWTSAQDLYVAVYRGVTAGVAASNASASNAAQVPGLTLTQPGWSHVAVFGDADEDAGLAPGLPAGMVSRLLLTSGVKARWADTDGPVDAWPGQGANPWSLVAAVELIPAETPVGGSLSTSWLIEQGVGGSLATSWHIDQLMVGGSLSTSWLIEQGVGGSLATSWHIAAVADWQANVRTTAYRAALLATQRTISGRVELVDYAGNPATYMVDGEPLSTDHLHASVEYAGEVAESWQADFWTTDPSWVPKDETHPLDPRSRFALRLWWGLKVGADVVEMPVGTVVPSDPQVDYTSTVVVKWTGRDMLSIPKASGWGGQVIDLGGMNVGAALIRLFGILAPTLTVRCEATDVVLPGTFEVGAGEAADDWAAVAEVAGWVVRTDRVGVIRCGEIPGSSVAVRELQEGPGCAASRIQRDISSMIYNRVVVTSSNPDVDPPVWGYDEDTNPGSPTYVGLGVVRELAIDSDVPSTAEACKNMASMQLGKHLRPTEGIVVTIPQDPTINYRDLVALGSPAAGVGGQYRASKWGITLPTRDDAGGPMLLTMMREAIP